MIKCPVETIDNGVVIGTFTTFGHMIKYKCNDNYILHNHQLESGKYFGITAQSNLKWDKHIKSKGKAAIGFLYKSNWCSTRFPHQTMFVSVNSNTMGVTRGAGTANTSGVLGFTPGLYLRGVRVAGSLVFCVMFCRSCCPFSFVHCAVYPSIYGF